MTSRPRQKPNASQKIAAALLKIKIGVEGGRWLIPEPLRSEGTAAEICSAVDWDHARRHAEGGTLDPQNLFPMIRADHREKSKTDTTEVAKGKRFGAKEEEHRERLAAKADGVIREASKNYRPIRSAGFQTNRDGGWRKPMTGPAERRS